MKRTEMLRIIKEVLDSPRIPGCDLECQILDAIEAAKMAPPLHRRIDRDGHYFKEGALHQWEWEE